MIADRPELAAAFGSDAAWPWTALVLATATIVLLVFRS